MRFLNLFPVNKLPLPNCWHAAWHRHAQINGLDRFPTQKFLKENPKKSRLFCYWIWQQLGRNQGYMCDAPNTEGCMKLCQGNGITKLDSLCYLSRLIRYEDPTLHFVLRRKFAQIRALNPEPPPVRPNSDTPKDPLPPVAVNMPRPRRWIFTRAISKSTRSNVHWLHEP